MTDLLLFAQEAQPLTSQLLQEDTLALMIGALAIVVGGILLMTHLWFQHRERLAMIRQGINPNAPADKQEVAFKPPQRRAG